MRETKEYFTCPNCHIRSFSKVQIYGHFRIYFCTMCGHEFMCSHEANESEVKQMFFKRKGKKNGNDDVESLVKKTADILNKRIDEVVEKNARLSRIIKYSTNEPTFRFGNQEYVLWINSGQLSAGNNLWMYIDKEEYKVYLSELDNVRPDKENCEFKVENDLVYFTILGETRYDTIQKFNFVIDYKKDKYVVTMQDIKKDDTNV